MSSLVREPRGGPGASAPPITRTLEAVLRDSLAQGEEIRLLAGVYGAPLAASDPDRYSHVNIILGGATTKVPALAGLSAVPNQVAYVLATKDFLLAVGSVGAAQIAGVGVPIGTVVPFAGDTAPLGYLLCNGQMVSKSSYSVLYGVVGTRFGDGGTTFGLPDLRGRAPYGAGGGGVNLGDEGGSGPGHHHSFSGGVSGSTGGVGDHQHPGVGDHQHVHPQYYPQLGSGAQAVTGTGGSQRYIITLPTTELPAAGAHQHGGAGAHSHSFSGSVSGDTSGGGSQDVPGYVGLNHIIRAL